MVLKETDLTPPSFAGVVTFSPVSLRTITACPAFTSRGPTSRRIGTPYKFKIKTSPKLSGDWLQIGNMRNFFTPLSTRKTDVASFWHKTAYSLIPFSGHLKRVLFLISFKVPHQTKRYLKLRKPFPNVWMYFCDWTRTLKSSSHNTR